MALQGGIRLLIAVDETESWQSVRGRVLSTRVEVVVDYGSTH